MSGFSDRRQLTNDDDNDGLENRFQFSPRIWHVFFTLHLIRSTYHSHSVASTAPCSRPANPLCVSTFARTFYTHPTSPFAHLPTRLLRSRTMASSSSSNPPPPAERAAEIIDKLPSHPSLITKTGTAILGSGLLATAISQELYVFNEETVIAVGYLILFTYIAKVRPLFMALVLSSWSRICVF